MPKSFEMCRKNGGKIRTKQMGGGKYAHICIDENGKTHMGEIKMKKMMGSTSKGAFMRAADKIKT